MQPLIEYALNTVRAERDRQEGLKAAGRFKYTCADVEMHDEERLAVLVEEVGETARVVLNRGRQLATGGEDGTTKKLREELAQVAAVAVAWIEALDKGKPR